ncbi:MAG: type VI secretion protein IcmF/TssM N-terminal domain-containing protein [Pirellulaceae bacterium]|nr:type VI secretion protein IcmF/TssM N-terminal domain-containing protein [Pirellulaceae bacterium]
MPAWLGKCVTAAKKLPKSLAKLFGKSVSWISKWLRIPRWIIECLLVATVVVALGLLNDHWRLDMYLTGPRVLAKYWLGLLALAGYLTVRLSLLLFNRVSTSGQEFSDIYHAIYNGCQKIQDANIDLRNTPLILVVGTDLAAEAGLSASSCVGDTIRLADPDDPIHWYGDGNALWVTLPGVSTVSRQLQRITSFGDKQQNPSQKYLRMPLADRQLSARRMDYALKLLRHVRHPVVPINGMQLMVPYSWVVESGSQETIDVVKIDMAILQERLDIRCDCQIILHKIEQVSEFSALLQSTTEEEAKKSNGLRLPRFTVVKTEDFFPLHLEMARTLRKGVYARYSDEPTSNWNATRFQLLAQFFLAKLGFTVLLGNAFADDIREPFYLSGIYFASLTPEQTRFYEGPALETLESHDESIGWADHTLRGEKNLKHLTTGIAACLLLLTLVDLALVVRWLF